MHVCSSYCYTHNATTDGYGYTEATAVDAYADKGHSWDGNAGSNACTVAGIDRID